MMNTRALFMAAASSESIKAAFAAANRDRLPSIGICVGMDTSAAPPDHKPFALYAQTARDAIISDLVGRDLVAFAGARFGMEAAHVVDRAGEIPLHRPTAAGGYEGEPFSRKRRHFSTLKGGLQFGR
jgi:hypothetical protein